MIRCKNIHLSFNKVAVFSNFNLLVQQNENVCISGASGRGKSSLLHLLQGYIKPQNGQVIIDREVLSPSTLKNIRNKIVYIPQNINLPVKNGNALVELLGIKNNSQQISSILNQLGLSPDFMTKDFFKISGGQKQRIIIAICLSIDKPIVLMDEPTASLDEASIDLLIKTTRALKGKTIVSASHNQSWAKSCQRIIEL
ncbi:MAG TPA: ATP-binding cassette domain-containing protein [Draconibacterium sp.]|nr:ATP-binding cassette domain-containing protein [Draconibacterium sp.]